MAKGDLFMEVNKFNGYVSYFRKALPIGQSFDIGERNISIGGREVYLYYVEGFLKSEVMEQMFHMLLSVTREEMDQRTNASEFIKYHLPYAQAVPEKGHGKNGQNILSGMALLIIDGYSEGIVHRPENVPRQKRGRTEKEKDIRGSKDVLVERFY
jgi:stage V sporulation protein AF